MISRLGIVSNLQFLHIYIYFFLTLFLTEINSNLLPVSNLIFKVRTSCNYKETVGSNVVKVF